MKASRTVILSKDEVCEAVRAYIRAKYHEKIEGGYSLVSVEPADKGFSFTFSESLDPFVRSKGSNG